MLRMAKRKPPKPPPAAPDPAPKQPRRQKPLHVWLEPALREALDRLAKRNRRLLTTEVEIALEKHLADEGLWPPRGEKGPVSD